MSKCNSNSQKPSSIEIHDLGTSSIRMKGQYFNTKPLDPVVGDLYMDTSNSKLSIWDGGAWILVDPGVEESIIDQFDVVTDDGFLKVKLYNHPKTNEKSVMIWDEDELFIKDTQNAIDFLKDNLKDKYYLWVEKRILNHLS